MDNLKIVGAPLPDMPWEDRPRVAKKYCGDIRRTR